MQQYQSFWQEVMYFIFRADFELNIVRLSKIVDLTIQIDTNNMYEEQHL